MKEALREPRLKAQVALLLLIPAPSIGTGLALYLTPGWVGQGISFACKIWLVGLPLAWVYWVDQGQLRLPKLQSKGVLAGVVSGLLIFTTILIAYGSLGQSWIDAVAVQQKAQQVGLANPGFYITGAAYWIFINALLEEYVWRWFVFQKWKVLLPGKAAIAVCALCFSLHHAITLMAYTDWRVMILGCLGVFSGAALWSWLYQTYDSIWPGYISHLLADVAIFIVGWQLLFAS